MHLISAKIHFINIKQSCWSQKTHARIARVIIQNSNLLSLAFIGFGQFILVIFQDGRALLITEDWCTLTHSQEQLINNFVILNNYHVHINHLENKPQELKDYLLLIKEEVLWFIDAVK